MRNKSLFKFHFVSQNNILRLDDFLLSINILIPIALQNGGKLLHLFFLFLNKFINIFIEMNII